MSNKIFHWTNTFKSLGEQEDGSVEIKGLASTNSQDRAGDVIECNFPKTTVKKVKEFDDNQQSGLYMIKELCHHFDAQGSYTSLKLIRDTFGQYGKNNK